ncbi:MULTISPECIES: hypothetical protein [Pseudomonadaceae]|uniref:hypothetical protein n=1 Tax=Pseudomonadaceae TaxID=135621 RepID=UPI00115033F7|nr:MULTISPECIES: hypothetical protein [Pseudomonas]MCP1620070.1 hypothetical protein [Pseudomonas otitidis]
MRPLLPKAYMTSVAIAALLSGCASDIKNESITEPYTGTLVPGKLLTSPTKLKAAVGEEMLTAGEYSITPSKVAHQTATMASDASAHVTHKWKTFDFRLAPARLAKEGSSSAGHFYKYPSTFFSLARKEAYGGLIAPNETPNIATRIYWRWLPSNENTFYTAPLKTPVKLNLEDYEEDIDNGQHQTPRQVLIYSGLSSGQIRFVYREFTQGGFSKPTLSQDVTLDYRPGTEYAFKEARFIVNKADTAFIEFTLLKGL